jgi:hypothetical protein
MAKALRILACAGAMFILAAGSAAAQTVGIGNQGVSLSPFSTPNKRPPTQEEIEKQQKLDDAYKAATNKIPDQKAGDPWAVVRPTSAAAAAKKKTRAQ